MIENTVNISGNEAGSVTEGLPKGFTYFVRDGDVIKIGSSVQPKKRIDGLQTGIARPLEVLAVVSMDVADEFTTHQRFAHLRVRGEWFTAGAELLEFIDSIKGHHVWGNQEEKPMVIKQKPEPSPMAKKLTICRRRYGANTEIGHRCTNLLEALPIYQSSTNADQRAHLAKNISRWTAELAGMLKAA